MTQSEQECFNFIKVRILNTMKEPENGDIIQDFLADLLLAVSMIEKMKTSALRISFLEYISLAALDHTGFIAVTSIVRDIMQQRVEG